jgi:hypothetical protein
MEEPSSTARGWPAFLILFCVAVLVRVAFFFDSVVGWDETTFILMGQSVLDGFVPYQDYWDLKPPVVYFAFALIDVLSLHTIVGVRVIGALLVAITAYTVFVLASRFASRGIALTVAVASIFLVSALGGGMGTLTEIVAMPLWMTGLVLLSRTAAARTAGVVFLGGVLLSLATLVRLNLAFAVVTTSVALLYFAYREAGWRNVRFVVGWLFVGGCVPIAVTAGYFAVRSDLAMLWEATVVAPLLYAGHQLTLLQVIADYARDSVAFPPSLLVSFAAAAGVVLLPWVWKSLPYAGRVCVVLALATVAGATYSIVTGGNAFGHYVIQVVSPAAVAFAAALQWLADRWPNGRRWSWRAVAATLGVCAAIGVYPTVRHVPELAARIRTQHSLLADEGYRLTAYLVSHMQSDDTLLLMDRHIAYWDTHKWPPTKILHPSNIDKAYMLPAIAGVPKTPEGVMQEIMSKKPTVIVTPDRLRYLEDGSAVDAVLRQALADDYRLETTIDTMRVFRRVRS